MSCELTMMIVTCLKYTQLVAYPVMSSLSIQSSSVEMCASHSLGESNVKQIMRSNVNVGAFYLQNRSTIIVTVLTTCRDAFLVARKEDCSAHGA